MMTTAPTRHPLLRSFLLLGALVLAGCHFEHPWARWNYGVYNPANPVKSCTALYVPPPSWQAATLEVARTAGVISR